MHRKLVVKKNIFILPLLIGGTLFITGAFLILQKENARAAIAPTGETIDANGISATQIQINLGNLRPVTSYYVKSGTTPLTPSCGPGVTSCTIFHSSLSCGTAYGYTLYEGNPTVPNPLVSTTGSTSACNTAPTASNVTASGSEGNTITINPSITDPEGDAYAVYWFGENDSSCSNTPAATRSYLSPSYTVGPKSDPIVITYGYKAQDNGGAWSSCATATVTWTNLNPSVTVTNSGPVNQGEQITFSANPSDPPPGSIKSFTYQWHNNSACTSPIGGETSPTYSMTLSSAGTAWRYVKVFDGNGGSACGGNEGVWNAPADTTPPTGSVQINSNATYTKTTLVNLNLTCADASGCSEMRISNSTTGGTWETYSATKYDWYLITGDGTKNVYVWFKDGAGNESSPYVSDSIILDQTSPSNVSFNPTFRSWDDTNITVTYTATDYGSGIEGYEYCSTTNGTNCIPGIAGLSVTFTSAGQYTVCAKANDRAGNIGNTTCSAANAYKIDKTAPTFSGKTDFDAGWYTSNQTSSFTYADAESGLLPGYTNPTCLISTEGINQSCGVTPTVCNNAGLCNTTPVISNSIKLDTTPPTFAINDGANTNWNVADTITVTANDGVSEPGTTQLAYSSDSTCDSLDSYSNGTSVTVNWSYTGYICFKNINGAGLTGYSSAIGPLKVDTTAPPAPTLTPASRSWGKTNVTVSFSATDGLSGTASYQYCSTTNGTNCTPGTAGGSVTFSSTGQYTVCARTKDNAGNTGSTSCSAANAYQVDKTAPTITSVTTSQPSCNTIRFTVNGASDSESGLAASAYSFDGGTNWQADNFKDFSGTSVTLAANSIKVRDEAGNIYTHGSSVSGTASACDITPPTTSITGPTGWQTANFTATVDDTSDAETCWARAYNTGTSPSAVSWIPRVCPDGGFTVDLATACTIEGTDKCTVQAYAVDAAGNVGAAVSRAFSIDKTKPTTTGPTGTQSWQNTDASSTQTTLGCEDLDGSGCDTAKDPLYCVGDAPCAPGTDYNAESKPSIACALGTWCQKYLRYQSTDNAGNLEATVKGALFRIDKEKPSVPGTPAGPTTDNDGVFPISWTDSSDGDGSGIAGYQLDRSSNGGVNWDTIETLTTNTSRSESLADGTYIYRVRAKDNVENWSSFSANSSAVLVDTTDPVVNNPANPTTIPNITSAVVDTGVTISGGCTSGDGALSVSVTSSGGGSVSKTPTCNSDGTWSTTLTPGDIGSLGDGTLTATITQTDAAGNTGTTSATATKDTVVPTATITNPPGGATNWYISTFNVIVNDEIGSDPTVWEARVYNNGTAPPAWASRGSLDGSVQVNSTNCTAEGANSCRVDARNKDAAGNVSVIDTRTFSIDRTAPDFSSPSAAPSDGGVFTNNPSLVFTANPTDSGGSGISTCYAQIDTDQDAANGVVMDWRDVGSDADFNTSEPPAITIISGNTYYYRYYCTDNAGNEPSAGASSDWSDGITVDTEGPSTSFISPTPPEGSWQNINFAVTLQDADLGGSGLTGCDFAIQSYISGSWQTTRSGPRTCGTTSITVTTGGTGDCRAPGGNTCKVQGSAGDNAGNTRSSASRLFSIGGGEFLIID